MTSDLTKKGSTTTNTSFFDDVRIILAEARKSAYSAINRAMVHAYWQIGKRIVEEEQNGKERADYGAYLIRELSQQLTDEFGKGFDEREIRRIRQFYLVFPIRDSLRPELSWSHYRFLMRVNNPEARAYYEKEAAEQMWSTRRLERNISTLYYERLLSSQKKEPVIEEMLDKTSDPGENKDEFIKNPYVLEFLNLPGNLSHTEGVIEESLLHHLQDFLLEMGKGFAFVGRQQLIRTETSDFYIDLVFYNYLLKCFVIVDLKNGKLTHQDVGQMDMYVRMYDDLRRLPGDNPTIGIILCAETDAVIVKYSILKDNEQLFASKYRLVLPSEEELKAEIEREQYVIRERQAHYDIDHGQKPGGNRI
jgi:predicted nuclease of restriction endonuclease-like (RecB) superfamily